MRKLERLFCVLPSEVRNFHGINIETIKRNVDKWLKTVPGKLRIDSYAVCVVVEKNSIVKQAME